MSLEIQLEILKSKLKSCTLCPHSCQINRYKKSGICNGSLKVPVAHICKHSGEEPPISGIQGSGTIFFAFCNMKCVFCQNYQISQKSDFNKFKYFIPEALAAEFINLQRQGAHNINLVSPTHFAAQIAEAIFISKQRGLVIPVIYNSNGYDCLETVKNLKGLIDIYLPDMKYADEKLAKLYSGVNSYSYHNQLVIAEMLKQVGQLKINSKGLAEKGLLVRHLVLPANMENTKKCLDYLACLNKNIYISIMSQYSPQYKAEIYTEINRTLSKVEYETIVDYAWNIGLKNAFIQELSSESLYLPDFDKENPFYKKS